jgi:hypothetical protein
VDADLAPKRRSFLARDHREGPRDGPSGFATFIVRISQDDLGRISGVVEWVRTGEKSRFHRLAAISEIIARVLKRAKRG